MSASLTFFGAAGTVTGSCTLLETGSHKILIDCGMFQGTKSLKELNYRPFAFDPGKIDAVLLTHAHIDHSGLIPKLVEAGFRGRVYATQPTIDLLTYMLPDSGYIQESEVERLNRRRGRHGEEPVRPIYTRADAERSLLSLEPIELGEWLDHSNLLRARYWPAGHILGAASVEIAVQNGGREIGILFSGDLGTSEHALHGKPEGPSGLDWVVCESTYGDRVRGPVTPESRRAELLAEVRAALSHGGNLLIPVFAVERTQELLFDLGQLMRRGELGKVPIFLDSPLAVHATEVFARHAAALGEAAEAGHPFDDPQIHFIEEAEDSKKLDQITSGAIIMAASGMCEAGRIRQHLLRHLWRPQSTVLIVGYQAPGTLGRLLLDGANAVRIMGQEILVRARIRQIEHYSAHADQSELVDWVKARQPIGKAVILTHGESMASTALADQLGNALDQPQPAILQPGLGARISLDPDRKPRIEAGIRMLQDSQLEADWHNLRSQFLLNLSERLRRAPDDAARQALLRDLQDRLGD
jgi:metallo-beta-lactamase family protein